MSEPSSKRSKASPLRLKIQPLPIDVIFVDAPFEVTIFLQDEVPRSTAFVWRGAVKVVNFYALVKGDLKFNNCHRFKFAQDGKMKTGHADLPLQLSLVYDGTVEEAPAAMLAIR